MHINLGGTLTLKRIKLQKAREKARRDHYLLRPKWLPERNPNTGKPWDAKKEEEANWSNRRMKELREQFDIDFTSNSPKSEPKQTRTLLDKIYDFFLAPFIDEPLLYFCLVVFCLVILGICYATIFGSPF